MKNLRLLLIISLGLLIVTSDYSVAQKRNKNKIKASKNYITREFNNFPVFDIISISDIIEVEYTQNNDGLIKVSAYGSDNVLELLVIENNKGTLRAYLKESVEITGDSKLKITLSSPELRRITGRDECLIKLASDLVTGNLTVILSGRSQLAFKKVTCGSLMLDASGGSKIKADYLKSEKSSINTNGVSSIVINQGSAEKGSIILSGSSKVNALQYSIYDTVISLSGSTFLTFSAIGTISGTMSGSSKLEYTGAPLQIVERSGGAIINGMQ